MRIPDDPSQTQPPSLDLSPGAHCHDQATVPPVLPPDPAPFDIRLSAVLELVADITERHRVIQHHMWHISEDLSALKHCVEQEAMP